jgi:hypothetical protein
MVMICDEDPVSRVCATEAQWAPHRVFTQLATTQALLDFSFPNAPACLVLETRYASVYGLDSQRHLIARSHHPQIVFLSRRSTEPVRHRSATKQASRRTTFHSDATMIFVGMDARRSTTHEFDPTGSRAHQHVTEVCSFLR